MVATGCRALYPWFNIAGDGDSTCSDNSLGQGRLCKTDPINKYQLFSAERFAFCSLFEVPFKLCAAGTGENSTCEVYWYQPLSSIAGHFPEILDLNDLLCEREWGSWHKYRRHRRHRIS